MELAVGSPFALYSLRIPPGGFSEAETNRGVTRLRRLGTAGLPPSTAAICESGVRNVSTENDTFTRIDEEPPIVSCVLVAPAAGGVVLWPASSDGGHLGANATILPVEVSPWRLSTGASIPCDSLSQLLPAWQRGKAASCLVLAGWDGSAIAVAVLPLVEGRVLHDQLGTVRTSRAAAEQRAAVAPLQPTVIAKRRVGVVALHLEPSRGRLWVVLDSMELEAFDIVSARSLGRRRPRWPLASPEDFHADAICEMAANSGAEFYAVGRLRESSPLLLRAWLPDGETLDV